MKTLTLALLILFGASLSLAKSTTSGAKFGELFEGGEKVSLAGAMDNYEQYEGKTIVFDATPKKVCEKKGCWMVLKDGDKQVRTLFKDYGFFVPKDILEHKVRVRGTMTKKKVSAATIRHYMKDEGKKMSDIKKVKTGREEFEFVAEGVEVI